MMTYRQAINYLESFINYEKIPVYPYKESLKLERIRHFLEKIGNPQDFLRCIHIAGTKGKGSTCAFISYMLREAGYRVGLYTSPHLSDFRERIRILRPHARRTHRQLEAKDFEGMIPRAELVAFTEALKPSIEQYNRASAYGPLSFFEVYTSLAFLYFKDKKVDFAVLETGLGGRLDATNVVDSFVCAVTPISYEHTQKLGNTLGEIAAEKAGIIKSSRSIVISAPQEKEAGAVIKDRCKKYRAMLLEVGRDIVYKKAGEQRIAVNGVFAKYRNIKIGLLGEHQFINAALAIGVIEALRFNNIEVGARKIKEGIRNTLWPGRCEIVSRRPLAVLDGAQNIASVKALKETILENFKYRKLILVFGISKDKDIKGICSQFYNFADNVILTKADNPRATEPGAIAGYFKGRNMFMTNNVKEAVSLARQKAGEKDLILVTGSLFVVGEARGYF